MRSLYASLCLFITLAVPSYAETYTVAAYAWEPFIDTKRADKGISIEVVRQALSSQGHSIEIINVPWSRALALLHKDKIDILPAVWFTTERTKTMTYSEAYAANRLVFIKPKESEYEYEDLESLHGKVIGVVRNYAYDEAFLKEEDIRFSTSDTLVSNVKKLLSGRIDLTIDDEIAARAIIPKPLLENLSFTKNSLSESPLYITCNKSIPKCKSIIHAFNQGLEELKANGKLSAILSNN